MDAAGGPLAGLRVLDLADYRAALCGRLLAELGAHVVKIEPPQGDPSRRFAPFAGSLRGPCVSLLFLHANAGKEAIALDLTAERTRFNSLAVESDVVVVSSTPPALEALGIDYASLAQEHPELVYVSITPFGATGPWRDRPASDLTTQAAAGMVWLSGDPGYPPLQGVGLPAYHTAAIAGAVGAILALLARRKAGTGQIVDVSMQAVAAGCVAHSTAVYRDTGGILGRRGARHWSEDFHVGPTADGDLMHTALGDWETLREWVQGGNRGPLDDPEMETPDGRRRYADRLFALLDSWASTRSAEELASEAQRLRLAYAAVRSPTMLRDDAQLLARQFLVPVPPEAGQSAVLQTRAPYRFRVTPCPHPAPAPILPIAPRGSLARGPHGVGAADSRRGTAGIGSLADPRSSPDRALAAPTLVSASPQPLAGIRILDLSRLVAGPVATRILADHGAEVIKLERPIVGAAPPDSRSLDSCLNRGKRSIAIDLGQASGRALAERLIAASDVMVENFSPRVFRNWGWRDERLGELNPRLVTLHLSAFGQTGPERDAVGFGPTLHARAGHTWLMRYANGRRAGWGFSFSDFAAGWRGALAVIAALWHRTQTGRGQAIDLSQYENLVDLLGAAALSAVNLGQAPQPIDNRSQEVPSAPHGVFRGADEVRNGQRTQRWYAIAVLDDEHWRGMCVATGNALWTRGSRLQTAAGRLAAAAALHRHLATWSRPRPVAAVVEAFVSNGVPAAVVADPAEVCCDPQLAFRGFWKHIPTADGTTVVVDGFPFLLSATPGTIRTSAPLPGADTDQVLRTVGGVGERELEILRASRTIG